MIACATRRAAACLAALCLFSAPAGAVSVRTWSASTETEFARGTLEGAAIDERGRIRLAPALETIWGPEQGVVWSVAPGGEGSVFVALSGPGRVVRVAGDGEAEIWFHAADESLVTALADDGAGGVFFGLSPEGEIFHATGSDRVERVAATDATFVWSLHRDARDDLWIGTGLPGLLLRRASGSTQLERWFDAGDDPVRCIDALPDGGVALGTGGRGRVVTLREPLAPFVLLDADEKEIVALDAAADGTIHALAAGSSKQISPRASAPPATGAVEKVRVVATPPPGGTPGAAPAAGPAKPTKPAPAFRKVSGGTLYRIEPDGASRSIWSAGTEMPFAMVRDAEGRLLIGTGDAGRIYSVDDEGHATRVLAVASEQASALARDADGEVLVGASGDARVIRLGAEPRRSGHYLSAAIDAGSVADWGRVRWDVALPQGSSLRLEARSGNTAEPDDTWHDWRPLRAGSAELAASAGVPPARWFQLRVELSSRRGATPELRVLEVFFQPRNRTPIIDSLSVERSGVVWVRGPIQSSARLGPLVVDDPVARRTTASLRTGRRAMGGIRKGYEAGARTVSWKAQDPDGDRLLYTLELLREGEPHGFPLTLESQESYLSWDARGFPDGVYRVRLIVRDTLDNPEGAVLEQRTTSDAFRIDNTRPRVDQLEVNEEAAGYAVEFVARDPEGSVAAVEVALDGGAWLPLEPLDGVADSESERYRWVPEPATNDTMRSFSVRVTDAAGNLGGEIGRLEQR